MDEASQELVSTRAQSSLKSISKDIPLIGNVSSTTLLLLIVPIVGILVVNIVLINANESLSNTALLAIMIVDVIFVVLFVMGFLYLADDLGKYVILHTKLTA